MDALLSFFSDLILFTAGLAAVTIWIAIILGVVVELYDNFTGKGDDSVDESFDQEDYWR